MRMQRILIFAALALVFAEAAADSPPDASNASELSVGRAEIVLEYTLIHSMLAENDPIPLLRIYQDGRVQVHYPVFKKRAGDYEMWMTSDEFDELFSSLAADGLMNRDVEAAKSLRRTMSREKAAQGEFYHVSDVTETVIKVSTQMVRRPASQARLGRSHKLDKTIRWNNVYTDAKRFPDLASVRSIAACEGRLRALMDQVVAE